MTDRELLELAALAAGVECDAKGPFTSVSRYDLYNGIHTVDLPWNPLTDDGDRYRLAKQLDIHIHFGAGYITYLVSDTCRVLRWPEDATDDAYAVVSAAAEIGSSMKGQK